MNRFLTLFLLAAAPAPLAAQRPVPRFPPPGYPAAQCPECAAWNAPVAAIRIFGNVYYVGTHGLTAILLTSPEGHVLLDAGLPESAPLILESIRSLGFRVEDIRLIVNSHVHYDHAGGIAALARASGAVVAARAPSASVLESGTAGPDDPQFGIALPYPAVPAVRVIREGDTLRVGPIAIVAHATAGHTPGGTSWSWSSCDDGRCLAFVYADSQTPISADGFRFTGNQGYPAALADFEHGFGVLERLSCDVILTPHPGASRLFERLASQDPRNPASLRDPEGCRRYALGARQQLARRVETESRRP